MAKPRLDYFDIAKLLAIIVVIYGHCIQHYLDHSPLLSTVYLLIYSFHMPLFMLISGYFSYNSLKLSFKSFIKKKSVQLLLPYVSWQILSIIVKFFLNDIDAGSIIRYDFWFLISLYICSLLGWCLCHLQRPYQVIFLLLTLIITQVSLFRLKDMYPCFLLGLLLFNKEKVVFTDKKYLCIISFVLYCVLAYFTLDENFFNVDFTFNGILKQLNIIIVGVSASIFIIKICQYVETNIPSFIKKVGQQTLVIYLIQSILFTITKDIINFSNVSQVILYLLIFPLIVMLFCIISLSVISLINHSSVCSLLLLGKKI